MPLVSVIIRTQDKPDLLKEAISSVAQQTYPCIEVIVVNDGGTDIKSVISPFSEAFFALRQIKLEENKGRAYAANIGLEAAKGDFIIFLDHDDLFDPDHIEHLVNALKENSSAGAAYSGVRVLEADGTEHTIFNEPFDPVKLRMEAYLPIHSVLFRRSLLDKGVSFDTNLQVYEDWDFWLQLSEITDFIHVDRFSATYRAIGTSGVGAGSHDNVKKAEAHKALLSKWLSKWTPEKMRDILERYQDTKRALKKAHEGFQLLAEEHKRIQGEYDKLAKEHICLVDKHNQLGEKFHRLNQELGKKDRLLQETFQRFEEVQRDCQNRINELNGQLSFTASRLEDVKNKLNAIQNSTFWKMTAPGRFLVAKIKTIMNKPKRQQ